jgi:hypothetical protein
MIEETDFSTDKTMQQAISLVISKTEKMLIVIFYHKGENGRMTD